MMPEIISSTYANTCILKSDGGNVMASLGVVSVPFLPDFQMMTDILHHEEVAYLQTLRFDKRRESYLIGRFAAKHALAVLTKENDLRKIEIQRGIFSQPIVKHISGNNMQVSITHCDEIGAAVAFPEEHPMGIDIEKVNADKRKVLEGQMTQTEKMLILNHSRSYDRMLTVLWTAKEALSKTLKTGLTTPLSIFELSSLESKHDHVISLFKNFGQYRAISFNLRSFVCSLVYPKNSEIIVDMKTIQCVFDPAFGKRGEQNMASLNACL